MNAIVARLFPGSKTALKMDAESAEAKLGERRRLVDEIGKLRASAAADGQRVAQALAKAGERRAAAQAELEQAQSDENRARRDLIQFDTSTHLGIISLEQELERSAPARIDEAIDALQMRWERARNIAPSMISRNLPEAAIAAAVESNRRIRDRFNALSEAMKAVLALKLEALTAEELEQRLAEIEASIPQL